jgi:hypothetical protein
VIPASFYTDRPKGAWSQCSDVVWWGKQYRIISFWLAVNDQSNDWPKKNNSEPVEADFSWLTNKLTNDWQMTVVDTTWKNGGILSLVCPFYLFSSCQRLALY